MKARHDEIGFGATEASRRFGLPPRSRALLLTAVAAAVTAGVVGVVPAHGSSPTYPQCQGTTPIRPSSGDGSLTMSDASLWNCGGDLVAQKAAANNGGPAGDTTFSSSHKAVPEECPPQPNQDTCGRGEFGYGGGELPFGSVLLNSQDSAALKSGATFGCPSTSTGNSAAVETSSTKPAFLLHAGNFAGSTNNSAASTSGDTQCYDPYGSSPSAAMGGANENGKAYEAACMSYASCGTPGGAGFGPSEFYIPENTSPAAGTNCAGHVLVAGGWNGSTDVANAALYDPRAKTSGGVANSNFNGWSSLSPTGGLSASMVTARDSAQVVQIGPLRWLIAGGESAPTVPGGALPTNTYEVFDGVNCGFLNVTATMNVAHYDSGAAKFADNKVLVCGGTKDFVTFASDNRCDVFTPGSGANGGTWTGSASTPTLASNRAGVFGQFLPTTVTSSNPHGNILMAGGDTASNGVSDSEECTESTSGVFSCGQNVAGWDNYCSDNSKPGCHTGSSQNDLGYTFDPNGGGIYDSSHVLLGYFPAQTTACAVGGDASCPINLPGQTANSSFDGLVLECGGFNPATSSTGNDTQVGCEYYVPSNTTIPTTPFLISGTTYRCGNNAPSGGKGPAWCTTKGSHLNRERAYFNLTELPATSLYTNGDPMFACGGFYGEDNVSFQLYKVRKNCEWLSKGQA